MNLPSDLQARILAIEPMEKVFDEVDVIGTPIGERSFR